MLGVIAQAGVLIALGVGWRRFRPMGLSADAVRPALTSVVYILLLPALALSVLWQAELGLDTVRLVGVAVFCVLSGIGMGWLVCRLLKAPPKVAGALILAAGYGNFTYLGLPILEASFGDWGRDVAIQFDLFAAMPLLLTLGILIAAAHGSGEVRANPWREVSRVPALWAALLGLALNLADVPAGEWLVDVLETLAAGVIPLMLIATGLALGNPEGWHRRLPLVLPVVAIRLLIIPFLVVWVALGVGLTGELWRAVVVEAGMPSMVLGLVIAERYGLDSHIYAETVTISTLLAAVTLPLWFALPAPAF
ncbi:MAG: AEC family transporter [Pseudomonadota bacterium]